MKTGLREIAKVHKGEFRLTGNQHLVLSNVADADLDVIKKLMARYKLDNVQFSALRLSSSACVAFPTCGLAMAESERYLPELITKLEGCLEETGLRQDSIVMRMTGCPNGCARPWLAEVAFVGKALGAYNMYLGGGYHGQRLNKLYRASIKEEEILGIMRPLLKRYSLEREEGERFGDFCVRTGVIVATREGRDFHNDVSNPFYSLRHESRANCGYRLLRRKSPRRSRLGLDDTHAIFVYMHHYYPRSRIRRLWTFIALKSITSLP